MANVAGGDEDPQTVAEWMRGLIYGPAPKHLARANQMRTAVFGECRAICIVVCDGCLKGSRDASFC